MATQPNYDGLIGALTTNDVRSAQKFSKSLLTELSAGDPIPTGGKIDIRTARMRPGNGLLKNITKINRFLPA